MLSTEFFIGLMSGTSLDGMDAALVKVSHQNGQIAAFELQESICLPLPQNLASLVSELSQAELVSFEQLSNASTQIAELSVATVQALLTKAAIEPSEITAIGSHGLTLRHLPELHYSWQLGEPNLIAQKTGIDVVADLRMADIAAGGQGAPLVPAFHRSLFPELDNTLVLNLGGIANLSVLSSDYPLLGFDTGPANTLLDAWCAKHTGLRYDKNADFARSGNLSEELLSMMMAEPYLSKPVPKSTGKELFNLEWLQALVDKLPTDQSLTPADVQMTLCHFTASSIAKHALSYRGIERLLVCGGGVHNPLLMELLGDYLPQVSVSSTAEFGVDPDQMEAMAFAWLAYCRIHQIAGNHPDTTGVSCFKVLGGLFHGRPV